MKKNSFIKVILVGVVSLLAVVAVGSYLIQAPQKESEIVVFEVKSGDTITKVASALKDEALVRSSFYVRWVAKQENLTALKVGRYALDKSWDPKTLLATLNDASQAIPDQVRVTLPEGFWAKDMAKRLSENTNVKADELLDLWNDKTYIQELMLEYPFLSDAIINDDVQVYLEGYLFPETYDFYSDTTAKAITKRLLDQTNLIYKKYQADFEASALSIPEIFTLASIVQFEGKHADDMAIIAGVFYNRLKIDMLLQSSVTICYALYEYDSWVDCERNPNIESPYNTYKYKGLPPGPILNPSEIALKATLNPTPNDYLYFIADVYGDGTIYFAKTLAEHEANVNKYLKGKP